MSSYKKKVYFLDTFWGSFSYLAATTFGDWDLHLLALLLFRLFPSALVSGYYSSSSLRPDVNKLSFQLDSTAMTAGKCSLFSLQSGWWRKGKPNTERTGYLYIPLTVKVTPRGWTKHFIIFFFISYLLIKQKGYRLNIKLITEVSSQRCLCAGVHACFRDGWIVIMLYWSICLPVSVCVVVITTLAC